jgi:cytochrome c biogenesis protein CcmG, thiol:disulfide interchange protein DsbE
LYWEIDVRAIYRFIALVSLCYAFIGTADAQLPEGLSANGARLVWVDFWASWCAPCRRSFPWMNEMQQKYSGDGFSVIAVNVDKERSLAEEFLAEFPAQFPVHYDPSGQLAESFDVQAMPSSFLMDADGNIIARHYGFRLADTKEYEAKIQAALESVATR